MGLENRAIDCDKNSSQQEKPRSSELPAPRVVAPSIGWVVNFASEFQIKLGNAHPREVFGQIRLWVKDRFPYHFDFRCGLQHFIQGTLVVDKESRISCKTESITGRAGDEMPQHWLMIFSHPQRDFPARIWQTRVGITALGVDRLHVSITNEHALAPRFIGEAPEASFTVPRLVRDLMRKPLDLWGLFSGDTRLLDQVQPIGHHELPQLAHAMTDSRRKLPLVILSPEEGSEETSLVYPTDPEQIGRALTGVASTFALTSNDVYQSLEWIGTRVRKEDLPHRGWVNVFLPGKPGDTDLKPIRLSVEEIRQEPEKFKLNLQLMALRYVLASRNYDSDGQPPLVRSRDDLLSIQRGRSLEQMRAALIALRQQPLVDAGAEADQKADDHIKQLEEYITLAEEEIGQQAQQLTTLKMELQSVREQLSDALSEAAEQKARANAYQEELKNRRDRDTAATLPEPQDIVSALRYVEQRSSGRIVILPEAIKTAETMMKQSCLTKPVSLKRALDLITNSLPKMYELKFERQSLDVNLFKQETGFSMSFAESPQVDKDPTLRRARTISYQGQAIYVPAHIKFGNRPGEQLRVHFFFNEDKRQLVIAKVVDHLPIASSRNDGQRA